MVTCFTLEASKQKFQVLRSAQHRTSEMSQGAMGCSEDVGQCLPLAGGLRHHLLQMQGLAQLLGALLLGACGFLQGSCRVDRAQADQTPAAQNFSVKGQLEYRQGLSKWRAFHPMRRAI